MVVDKKGELSSNEKLEQPITGFKDSDKVRDIHNDIFSLVITTTMYNFDVLMILIDWRRSYDIMYIDIFEKLGLKNDKLLSYMSIDLRAFNG